MYFRAPVKHFKVGFCLNDALQINLLHTPSGFDVVSERLLYLCCTKYTVMVFYDHSGSLCHRFSVTSHDVIGDILSVWAPVVLQCRWPLGDSALSPSLSLWLWLCSQICIPSLSGSGSAGFPPGASLWFLLYNMANYRHEPKHVQGRGSSCTVHCTNHLLHMEQTSIYQRRTGHPPPARRASQSQSDSVKTLKLTNDLMAQKKKGK